MTKFLLPKGKIIVFLEKLSDYKLYAPMVADDILIFDLIKDLKKFSCDAVLSRKTVKPSKGILFPQTETIYRFNASDATEIGLENDKGGKAIIFGIRPCDARSFMILDKVFNNDPPDPYYTNRHETAVTVGIACNVPGSNCFCTSVGGGPACNEGLDVIFTDLGDRYVIEPLTKRGKNLIDRVRNSDPELITKCSQADSEKASELHEMAERKMPRSVSLDGLPDKLEKLYEYPYWSDISSKCIACGICTYLCPTCHCFDMQDEAAPLKTDVYKLSGKKVRVWDSCMFPEYTLQASGYNPRPLRMHRIKNRVYHKYKWYPENFDSYACVGCGRCIDHCPTNVDIIEILSKVMAIKD